MFLCVYQGFSTCGLQAARERSYAFCAISVDLQLAGEKWYPAWYQKTRPVNVVGTERRGRIHYTLITISFDVV
jgi:hypothetical protein